MGENAALDAENSEASPSTKNETVHGQQNDLDRAIKELGSGGVTATSRPTNTSSNSANSASQSANSTAPIWDIPVDVNIVMGTAELTVARLMELKNGDVVELNRRVGEPLDIAVNGQNIAKGKIVMNENDESQFAIQITELVGR